MSLMNALWDFPYTKLYYFKHPLKWLKDAKTNIKNAWHRATRGWCWSDAAEMDEFLLHLIPPMLQAIGEDIAYPGTEPFETLEKWQEWCNNLAKLFESLWEENWENSSRNEWREKWETVLEEDYNINPNFTRTSSYTKEECDEIRCNYWKKEKELWDEREKLVQKAYMELAKYHGYLWI